MNVRLWISKAALRERLTFDSRPLREPAAWSAYSGARALTSVGTPENRARGFKTLMRLHGQGWSPAVDRRIVDAIKQADQQDREGQPSGLHALYDSTVQAAVQDFRRGPNPDPLRFIGARVLVVKAARPSERGVLVVDYSYIFPTLAGFFDLPRIADRYTLVLEPSWTGTCTPEILNYSRLDRPVLLQTVEPRDRELHAQLGSSLSVIPIAANWWVDPRLRPPARVIRDIDIVMVAAWAEFKRHWRFFRVLSELRKRGKRLKVALVGYRGDLTQEDIASQARYFGVADQLEFFERIAPDAVAALLARSKLHVLWSRREGSNRAIIEAMLADVPVIVRDGLSFGVKYPYINPQTGHFVREDELGERILEMLENRDHYSPREWVLENMTGETATAALETRLREMACAAGEPWTEGLVPKTSSLDSQSYWNPNDHTRFESDYNFLRSTILSRV